MTPQTSVLILSELFPNAVEPHRGAFVAEQAAELARRVSVSVVAPLHFPWPVRSEHRRRRRQLSCVPEIELLAGARVCRPRYSGWPGVLDRWNADAMFDSILRAVRRERLRPDLVHAHFAYPTGLAGLRLARWLGRPFVLTAHGYDIDVYARTEDSVHYGPEAAPFYSAETERQVRSVLARSDRVLTVSERMKEKLLGLGVAAARLSVVGDGVDVERFHPMDRRQARRLLNQPEGGKWVLFVGGMRHRKGIATLLEAAPELLRKDPSSRLVLIGEGPLLPEAKTRFCRQEAAGRVFFPGPRPRQEMPLWMGACDALVLPSTYESFGCVLMEALASGRPVVASRAGAIPEFIRDPEHGALVEPGRPELLAQAVLSVLGRRWDPCRLAAHARQHTWSKVADRTIEQYEAVLGAPTCRQGVPATPRGNSP